MDKREEFEKPENYDNWPLFWQECYKDGRESRDKEIESLKQDCENLVALNNDLSMRLRRADSQIVINKQKKEIKKLRDVMKWILETSNDPMVLEYVKQTLKRHK